VAQRGRVMSLFGATARVSVVLGPALGGLAFHWGGQLLGFLLAATILALLVPIWLRGSGFQPPPLPFDQHPNVTGLSRTASMADSVDALHVPVYRCAIMVCHQSDILFLLCVTCPRI
jgi:MFS family permease